MVVCSTVLPSSSLARARRDTTDPRRPPYRCIATQTRALPAYLADHPKSLYVREDAVVKAVDRWLPTLADPEWLAASQEPDAQIAAQHVHLEEQLAEIDKPPTIW